MFSHKFLADLFERAFATYLQAFAGFLIAGGIAINIATIEAAGLAAIPAALSVLKSMIATHFGDPDSASLLPGEPLIDGQQFRWIDFPHTFEVVNPDGSVAWGGEFADGAWEAVADDDEDEDGEVA